MAKGQYSIFPFSHQDSAMQKVLVTSPGPGKCVIVYDDMSYDIVESIDYQKVNPQYQMNAERIRQFLNEAQVSFDDPAQQTAFEEREASDHKCNDGGCRYK